ncbi:6808_t:CDS:10 [Diversispora eburnea]|uniref:6808_t:CDS:1 n=1 Tax=Diversispora eburnea TaxID=1213867 RepID=A0A9N8VPH7_9GLOM|nr:6808_t:CDS:10 [Diversispora eburnea]
MIRSSLNLIVLLITWITIFSLTSSVSGSGTFTHIETNSYSNPPRMWQKGKYSDGTAVIRIINRDSDKNSSSGEVWTRPVLSLRIIHPNGTVSEIDKDLKIEEFNWHITTSGIDYMDPISIYALHKGFILVRYFNASNSDDYTTYQECGRIIDWNGNLYSEVSFGGAYVENGIWYPTGTAIITNIDPSKGFIRITGRNASFIEWQQYMIDDSFNLIKLSHGNITFPLENRTSAQFNTIANVDEGYSIIIGNSTNATDSNPLIYHAALYDLTIGYNETQFSAPKLLYQIPLSNISIDDLFCGISSTGVGQVCTLNVRQSSDTNSTNYKNYYVRLNFLSSGSVTEVTPINRNLPELPSNSTTGWQVESIPYGGYLFRGYFINNSTRQTNAYVYYFDELLPDPIEWDLPEPTVLNLRGILLILPNNTLLVSQVESTDTWGFLTTDIPKYSKYSDNGYSNLLVKTTNPPINATINPTKGMSNITITYYEPVELSDGYIRIYQVSNTSVKDIVRQYVDGKNKEYCSISDDGLTVHINVIKSVFSNSYSQFYIKVDNNFVKSKSYGEPLIGISENIWKFNTNSNDDSFAATTSGVMRLTTNGTNYFQSLDKTGQENFFHDLQTELSEILPVDSKRLNSNQKIQVDSSISPDHPIFISLTIQSSTEERSVQSIIDDLNDMIKYKSITSIGLSSTTSYLDEDYGFVPKENLWDKYKFRFLGVILAFGILGRNMAVLQLGLILFDFVMDTLFVSNNGKTVEVLYIPSVIFLTVPIVVNTVWAFYIIIEECKPEKNGAEKPVNEYIVSDPDSKSEKTYKNFFDWFSQHGKVASVFTVLAGADIEALSILYSNMAGFEFFRAPFSKIGKERIFWASCLNIFLEDIPQVIIQILYQQSVVTYDIIPILTLVSSCLNLLINIVGRLYQAINLCRHGTLEYVSPQSQENQEDREEFGGLQPSHTLATFDSTVVGIVVFSQDECGSTFVAGLFSDGLVDPEKNCYEYLIIDKCGKLLYNLTSAIDVEYRKNGTYPFSTRLDDLNLDCDSNGVLLAESEKKRYVKRDTGSSLQINQNGQDYASAPLDQV